MTLRDAVVSDAPGIALLSIEVWSGTYLRKGIGGVFADFALGEFTTANIETLMAKPGELFVVSDNDDGIDAFMRISFDTPSPVARGPGTEIATLYVQPRHQGRGLGKALMAEAIRRCRARAIPSVWVATNSENTPAIRFYTALGFSRIGHTHFDIGDQAYPNDVLALDLPLDL